jgi:cell division protein ZapE
MMLARLLEALFAHGITIVTTSNVEPDQLYKNGLQRSSFLPAITLIKQHLAVTHITSREDYRLSFLKSAGVYYTPDDQHATQLMEKTFALISHHQPVEIESIPIHDRPVSIIKKAGDTIWLDFNAICRPPRSQHDYLYIAKHYKNVLISHIPVIPAGAKDTITLFIRMVDIFYDARIRLIVSAESTPDKLYTDGLLLTDYQRTQSRLMEMQSEHYFISN